MLIIGIPDYDQFDLGDNTHVTIRDHMGGFDQNFRNPVLDRLQLQIKQSPITVKTEFIVNAAIKSNYPEFDFSYDLYSHQQLLNSLIDYKNHPDLTFDNFICSFNGTPHVSRKLLVSILKKFGYFDPDYCSKNFSYTEDSLDGHLMDMLGDRSRFYRKFFVDNSGSGFHDTINDLKYQRYGHDINIYNLEQKITQSFLHVVSESIATSYYPNLTEKSFYSIVTRGLFLCYAQPTWHDHLEKYYGFKKYDKIFDYRFDSIQNPVERLVELMTMISKFRMLSKDEYIDLYQMEQDTIEYNYDRYFSLDYLKSVAKYQ